MKRIWILLLICCLMMFLVGCSEQGNQSDVADNGQIKIDTVEAANGNEAVNNFSVNLLKVTNEKDNEEDNILLSPLSVAYVLSMTANGAQGETLAQFEKLFGISISEMNEYLSEYMKGLSMSDSFKINLANSLWIDQNKGIEIKDEFIQKNKQYYNAEIFETPFDKQMVNNVNNWVSENTDGMIDELLENVSDDEIMFLINAICLDAKWNTIYATSEICEGIFTSESGDEEEIELMHSIEDYYLENENVTGVMKYYGAGSRYAFVGLLPKDNLSLDDTINALDGKKLHELLSNAQEFIVETRIPKFETEYDVNMNDILAAMGMKDAFLADLADFSLMSDNSLYISKVLHETNIAVDESGTKAGAATVVGVEEASESPVVVETKQVYLNRPFIYMIVDCKENIPLFIGTIKSLD